MNLYQRKALTMICKKRFVFFLICVFLFAMFPFQIVANEDTENTHAWYYGTFSGNDWSGYMLNGTVDLYANSSIQLCLCPTDTNPDESTASKLTNNAEITYKDIKISGVNAENVKIGYGIDSISILPTKEGVLTLEVYLPDATVDPLTINVLPEKYILREISTLKTLLSSNNKNQILYMIPGQYSKPHIVHNDIILPWTPETVSISSNDCLLTEFSDELGDRVSFTALKPTEEPITVAYHWENYVGAQLNWSFQIVVRDTITWNKRIAYKNSIKINRRAREYISVSKDVPPSLQDVLSNISLAARTNPTDY